MEEIKLDLNDLEQEEQRVSNKLADKSSYQDSGDRDPNWLHLSDSMKKEDGKWKLSIRMRFLPNYFQTESGTVEPFVGGVMHAGHKSVCSGKGCKFCDVGWDYFHQVKDEALESGLSDDNAKEVAKKKANFHFSKESYFRNVLIIDDKHNPKNNGKILVFRAGKELNVLIAELSIPSQDQIDAGQSPLTQEQIDRGQNSLNVVSLDDGNDFLFVRTMGDKDGKPDHTDTSYSGSLFFPANKSKQFGSKYPLSGEDKIKAYQKIFSESTNLKQYYDPENMVIKTEEEAEKIYKELFEKANKRSKGGSSTSKSDKESSQAANDEDLLKKMEEELAAQAAQATTANNTDKPQQQEEVKQETKSASSSPDDDFFSV